MSKGIEISFMSNTRDLIRGAGDVDQALDKVSDALDDVTRDGDKASRKLERSFRDVSAEARAATGDIGRAGTALEQTGRKGRDLETDVRVGTSGAGEAVSEFGDEAKQNIAETFSSFRGEAGDFVQIAQDTFGGVISNLGPLGMAAGAAGALGIGLIQGAMEDGTEATEALSDRTSDLAADFIETGGVGESSIDAVVDRLKELATTTEEGQDNLADLRADAENSVTGYRKIADAYAGNIEELDKLIASEEKHLEVLTAASNETGITWRPEDWHKATEKAEAQERIVAGLKDAKTAAEGAAEGEAAYLASNGPALEARAEQLDAIQSELDDTITSWDEYVNKETGAIDPAAYLAGMQARREAISSFNTNVQSIAQTFHLSAEETQAILDMGLDFGPHLQSIIDSGLSAQFVGEVQAAVGGGQAIIDGTPLGATVDVAADTDDAEAGLAATATDRDATIRATPETKAARSTLDAAAAEKREAKITAKAEVTAASRDLDAVASKSRTAAIKASIDLSAAERDLTAFINRQRTTTITATVVDRSGKPVP